MANKYYVWKDPNCGGQDIQWVELTGREFFALFKQPENKLRRFVRLGNEISDDEDMVYLEATEAQYIEWRNEKNARYYRAKQRDPYTNISIDMVVDKSEYILLAETIADAKSNTEDAAFASLQNETLHRILMQFTDKERYLITQIYFKNRAVGDLAIELGVAQSTVSMRLKRLLKRLKKFF